MDLETLLARVTALEDRLDKHAALLRKLKEAVGPVAGDVGAPGSVGVYAPKPTCVVCGADKHGRTTLTCAPCAKARAATMKTDRASVLADTCANCGASFKPAVRLLCLPCSKSFKMWKIDH